MNSPTTNASPRIAALGSALRDRMPGEDGYLLAAVQRGLNSFAVRQGVRRATQQDRDAAAAYLMTSAGTILHELINALEAELGQVAERTLWCRTYEAGLGDGTDRKTRLARVAAWRFTTATREYIGGYVASWSAANEASALERAARKATDDYGLVRRDAVDSVKSTLNREDRKAACAAIGLRTATASYLFWAATGASAAQAGRQEQQAMLRALMRERDCRMRTTELVARSHLSYATCSARLTKDSLCERAGRGRWKLSSPRTKQ